VNKHPSYSKRLIHNSLFNLSATVGTSIIAFFLVPFLVKYLGKDAYGVWVLIGSVFAYAMTLQLGLSSAINRQIPVFLVKKDIAGVNRVISTSVFFFAFVGLVVVLIALVVAKNLEQWFSIPNNLVDIGKTLVLVVGGLFAVSMPMQPFGAVISGLQRYDVHSFGRLIPIALRAALVIWALSAGYGLLAVGLVFGLSEITIHLIYMVSARRLLSPISVSTAAFDFALLKEMLAYGFNTFLYLTTAVVVFKASDIILAVFMTAADVTRFAIAAAPLLMITQLIRASVGALKPAVSDLDARDDHDRVREISFLGQKYSLLLLIPAISFLVVMGREFLVLWVGGDFADLGTIVAVLALGRLFMEAQYSNFLVLVGKGEHKVFGVMAVSVALSAVALGIGFVGGFKWGVMGMAVANTAPMMLIYGIIMPVYYNRRMSLSTMELVRFVFRPAIAGCLPPIAVIGLWKLLAPPGSWPQLGMVIVSVAVVWALSAWRLSLNQVERARFLGMLSARGARGHNSADKEEE